MERQQILNQLAGLIVSLDGSHPTRVAIDGVDASGKTTLANELAPLIERLGRSCIRASVDGFHRPKVERYRRGKNSPAGYYLDSFDNEAIRTLLLEPLGPSGSGRYRRRVFDFRSDSPVDEPDSIAPADAVLLFDGVFLLRPELNSCWDFRVFVDVGFDETVRRACTRDIYLFGSKEAILDRYWNRYVPGQRIYLETVRPQRLADAILDNADPANPRLTVQGNRSS